MKDFRFQSLACFAILLPCLSFINVTAVFGQEYNDEIDFATKQGRHPVVALEDFQNFLVWYRDDFEDGQLTPVDKVLIGDAIELLERNIVNVIDFRDKYDWNRAFLLASRYRSKYGGVIAEQMAYAEFCKRLQKFVEEYQSDRITNLYDQLKLIQEIATTMKHRGGSGQRMLRGFVVYCLVRHGAFELINNPVFRVLADIDDKEVKFSKDHLSEDALRKALQKNEASVREVSSDFLISFLMNKSVFFHRAPGSIKMAWQVCTMGFKSTIMCIY